MTNGAPSNNLANTTRPYPSISAAVLLCNIHHSKDIWKMLTQWRWVVDINWQTLHGPHSQFGWHGKYRNQTPVKQPADNHYTDWAIPVTGANFSKFQRMLHFSLGVLSAGNLKRLIKKSANDELPPGCKEFTHLCCSWIPRTSLVKTKLTTYNSTDSTTYKHVEAQSVMENCTHSTKNYSCPNKYLIMLNKE
jgi:hypothetical protein